MPILNEVVRGRRGLATIIREALTRKARVDMIAGVLVVQDSASDVECDVPASSLEVTQMGLGVSAYVSTKQRTTAGLENPAGRPVDIIRKGEVYMVSEEPVAASDPVFVRFAANGGNTTLGAVRNDVDVSCVACPQIRFDETTSAAGIVRCVVNFP